MSTRPNSSTLRTQREIQRSQDQRDAQGGSKAKPKRSKDKPAVQAGARRQPARLPAQHVEKPGLESELALAPRFQAPDYRGSGKLHDFAALITGADSGIGRAVAVLFAREGADVAVAYHSSTEDARETQRCVEAEGRRCLLLQGDVKDSAWCDDAVKRTVAAFGRLDVLVNNAAFQEHAESLEDLDDRRWQETLDTNVGGYIRMARAALPHLKRGASIINTGSVTGLRGSEHLIDYSATKGAIHALTKALASNLVDRGIRVNAVCPGDTFVERWVEKGYFEGSGAVTMEEAMKESSAYIPMGRFGKPEEIAQAVLFLASDDSSFVTGHLLLVDGGNTAQ